MRETKLIECPHQSIINVKNCKHISAGKNSREHHCSEEEEVEEEEEEGGH